MHLAAARHVEGVGALLGDMEGHVLQQLLLQPVPQVPGGDELALLTGKGRIVDRKSHFNGGIGNFHEGQGLHALGGAQGTADGDVRHAAQGHDFAGAGLLNGGLGQAVKGIQGHNFALLLDFGIVIVADGDLLVDLDGAPLHTAHRNPAHILVIIDGGNQQLQRCIRIPLRGGNIVDNGLKQGGQVGAGLIRTVGSGTLTAGAEDGRRVELLIGGVQLQQQLQHFVHHFMNPGIGLVNLVHRHDDLVAQLQGLLQHKPGLGHGAFGSVHQQDDAIDHFQNPLHLAAEIRVARGVHDVDLVIFIVYCRVLGQDGNTPLPFQVAGVHNPLHGCLIFPVDAALLQHLVHQRGLAVVDVGNDGNIANFVLRYHILFTPSGC